MASLTIRHVTTYRYRRPVAFGEHRMMLRPRDTREQMVVEASLQISPRPASLRLVRDALGNHVGIADFFSPLTRAAVRKHCQPRAFSLRSYFPRTR